MILEMKLYSRLMKSAVSIASAAAAKRHTSLCGCAHHIMLRDRFIWHAVYIRKGNGDAKDTNY